nr:MAG TPA_asm: hypothetical protein [Caudoviricetes sp.]
MFEKGIKKEHIKNNNNLPTKCIILSFFIRCLDVI